ncbi:WGR domain-containing protein [Pendulispora albinea]|uniref:WGR domain-containing protein n=1 Tax=Pendulispora albinea TaxID=2741071 RepID=A0ABZ2LQG7_9BACT
MAIRRLENEDEEKFWEAWIKDGLIFCYRYGKLGSAGHTKLKKFKTQAEAEDELAKKLEEKLAEGFSEVGDDQGAAAASADANEEEDDGDAAGDESADKGDGTARGATPADSAVEEIPIAARFVPRADLTGKTNAGDIEAAQWALTRLAQSVGNRSWQIAHTARKARKALGRVAGIDPKAHAALGQVFDQVMGLVVAPEKRLSLEWALGLLWELDAAAFERAVRQWQTTTQPSAASAALEVLGALLEAVEPEVALQVGAALLERRLPPAAWRRRFEKVRPGFIAALRKKGKNGKKAMGLDVFLDSLLHSSKLSQVSSADGSLDRDPIVRARIQYAREMAS